MLAVFNFFSFFFNTLRKGQKILELNAEYKPPEFITSDDGMTFIITDADGEPDCEFSFRDSDATIKTNQSFLAKESPVFASMFDGPEDTMSFLFVTDVGFEVFKQMIRFIYQREANIPDIEFACELHFTATKYSLPSLKKHCMYYLLQNLTPSNFCSVLDYALLVKEEYLLRKCSVVTQSFTKDVLDRSVVNECSVSVLEFIFSHSRLTVDSELDLYAAAEQYAWMQDRKLDNQQQAPEKPEAKVNKEEEVTLPNYSAITRSLSYKMQVKDEMEYQGPWIRDGPNENSPIRRLLHQIRFLTMIPAQFVETDMSQLLTSKEKAAILENMLAKNTRTPMPKHFSDSRVPRTEIRHCTSLTTYSSHIVESHTARHDLRMEIIIPFVSSLVCFKSTPFFMLGKHWRVIAMPQYLAQGDQQIAYMGLYLQCLNRLSDGDVIQAVVFFRLLERRCVSLNFADSWPYHREYKLCAVYSKEQMTHGVSNFVNWNSVRDTVHNDALTVELEVCKRSCSCSTCDWMFYYQFQT